MAANEPGASFCGGENTLDLPCGDGCSQLCVTTLKTSEQTLGMGAGHRTWTSGLDENAYKHDGCPRRAGPRAGSGATGTTRGLSLPLRYLRTHGNDGGKPAVTAEQDRPQKGAVGSPAPPEAISEMPGPTSPGHRPAGYPEPRGSSPRRAQSPKPAGQREQPRAPRQGASSPACSRLQPTKEGRSGDRVSGLNLRAVSQDACPNLIPTSMK